MLQLPAELRLMILQHLKREDLLSLLTVNKELKTFVHPLFYQHMRFTRAGFAFPHAPNAYPLLAVPNLKVATPVSKEDRERIINSIRSISITPHNYVACTGWQNLQDEFQPSKADVLTIELAEPSSDGVAGCHWPLFCEKCGSVNSTHDQHCEDKFPSFLECGYMNALVDTAFRKIVVKNYPALLNGDRHSTLPSLSETVKEIVFVLEPWTVEDIFSSDSDASSTDTGICPDPDDNLGATGIMNSIPPSATDVTLVFMTSRPGREWAPHCRHYNDFWYRRAYHERCPNCHDWHSDDDTFDTYDDGYIQQSCWQSAFWFELAAGITQSKARITLVNYSSIIPDGVNRKDALAAIKSNKSKRQTVRKTLQRELRDAYKSKEEYEERLANVRFLSMESWIQSGEWEDVFERKEITDWLDRAAKAESKAKWKALFKRKAEAAEKAPQAALEELTARESSDKTTTKATNTKTNKINKTTALKNAESAAT